MQWIKSVITGITTMNGENQINVQLIIKTFYNTLGIFERNEYIPYGNELVPYEITYPLCAGICTNQNHQKLKLF